MFSLRAACWVTGQMFRSLNKWLRVVLHCQLQNNSFFLIIGIWMLLMSLWAFIWKLKARGDTKAVSLLLRQPYWYSISHIYSFMVFLCVHVYVVSVNDAIIQTCSGQSCIFCCCLVSHSHVAACQWPLTPTLLCHPNTLISWVITRFTKV